MRLPIFFVIPVILLGVLAFQRFSDPFVDEKPQRPADESAADGQLHIWPADFSRNDLADFLQSTMSNSPHLSSRVAFHKNGASFDIDTTIDEKDWVVRDGIVVIPHHTVIPESTVIAP